MGLKSYRTQEKNVQILRCVTVTGELGGDVKSIDGSREKRPNPIGQSFPFLNFLFFSKIRKNLAWEGKGSSANKYFVI